MAIDVGLQNMHLTPKSLEIIIALSFVSVELFCKLSVWVGGGCEIEIKARNKTNSNGNRRLCLGSLCQTVSQWRITSRCCECSGFRINKQKCYLKKYLLSLLVVSVQSSQIASRAFSIFNQTRELSLFIKFKREIRSNLS